jgi:hypothetical protein
MTAYENKRKLNKLKEHQIRPKNQMKMPEKNIAVVIRKGLIIYTDDASKIEMIKQKFANK